MADLTAVNEIISDWRQGDAVPEIDKDIVVEKLRSIYSTVKALPVSEVVGVPLLDDAEVFIGSEGQLLSDDSPALGSGDDEPDVERRWPDEEPDEIAASPTERIEPEVPDEVVVPVAEAPAPVGAAMVAEESTHVEVPASVVQEPVTLCETPAEEESAPVAPPQTSEVVAWETPAAQEPATVWEAPAAAAERQAAVDATAVKPSRRDVLKALYDDEPAADARELSRVGADMIREGIDRPFEPAAQEPAVPEPGANIGAMPRVGYDSAQGKTVLGDVLGTNTRTLGDTYASGDDVASKVVSANASSLHANLGLNDRFQLARDLFGGDTQAFEAALDKLDSFADLDDAMVYIYENFAWSPDSESVQRVVDLLTRKLG